MNLQAVIPVPIYLHSGNSAPMTEHEAKLFAGFLIAFIGLTIILDLIVWVVAMIKQDLQVLSILGDNLLLVIMNAISGFVILISSIAWVGSHIAKLL